MTSLLDSISRTLGFAAARRGRELSALSAQHDGERFRNVKPRPVEGFGKTLRIAWNVLLNKPSGTVPLATLPVDRLTREDLDAAPDRSLYRLGHSTVLLKLRGEFWLTDPVFAERASPFRRFGPKRFHAPPIALEDLPPLAGVILSHDHYDHLDHETVLALAATTKLFVTPLGVGDRLIEWGIDARQGASTGLVAKRGDRRDRIHRNAWPAFSGRSLFDGNSTLWASWVIVDNDLRVFFSGDTGATSTASGLSANASVRSTSPLVETGAYDAQWPYVHMQHGRDGTGTRRFAWPLACAHSQRHVRSRDAPVVRPVRARAGLAAARGVALSHTSHGRAARPHSAASWRALVA